jgi:molybdopterin-biosynthesis enzyme MoeA-like protein
MAGVPSIFQAMIASVVPLMTGGAPLISETIRIDRPEGDVAGPLAGVASANPGLSIGSYPFNNASGMGSNVVIRGSDGALVAQIAAELRGVFAGFVG